MFCGTCGKELREGANFCDNCGAVQQTMLPPLPEKTKPVEVIQPVLKVPPKPPKQKKQRKPVNKKHLALAFSILSVVLMAAVLIPILFPGTETVYVLTEVKYISPTGEVSISKFEADEFGNPIKWGQRGVLYEAEYDQYGNLTEYADSPKLGADPVMRFQIEYDYDEKERIQAAEVIYGLAQQGLEYEFTWDEKGNLTQIIMEGPYLAGALRWDYIYDREGRLVQEYRCMCTEEDTTIVSCLIYIYDREGRLSRVYRGGCRVTKELDEIVLENLDCAPELLYEMDYDENGRLTRLEICHNDNTTTTKKYHYDSDGNLIFEDDKALYDDKGNLIRLETESGAVYEYTYEPVEMTHAAAQRYRHSARHYNFDPIARELYPANYLGWDKFYYLIPNPIW